MNEQKPTSRAQKDGYHPLGKGAFILLVPIIAVPIMLAVGAIWLTWALFFHPSRLTPTIWISVSVVLMGLVLIAIGKIAPRGSRIDRAMSSTDNSRFYTIGATIGLCVSGGAMLFHSSTMFASGLALTMAALVIDILIRAAVRS